MMNKSSDPRPAEGEQLRRSNGETRGTICTSGRGVPGRRTSIFEHVAEYVLEDTPGGEDDEAGLRVGGRSPARLVHQASDGSRSLSRVACAAVERDEEIMC